MQKKLAFLLVDLSGYTALTEKHGGKIAADIVSKFVTLIQSIIKAPCEISERIGDELIITSKDPNALVDLARKIIEEVKAQVNFPSFHGGLHYGEIYIAENNFFGSTINLASRILSHAKTGTILASEDFNHCVSPDNTQYFEKVGETKFKNIVKPVALYQLNDTSLTNIIIDPVCRMQVKETNDGLSFLAENDQIYHFCSEECLKSFEQDPNVYLER